MMVSDTGELRFDRHSEVLVVDTPRSQAVIGMAGGRRVETGDVVFELDNPWAMVTVSSLTEAPIATSERLLDWPVTDENEIGLGHALFVTVTTAGLWVTYSGLRRIGFLLIVDCGVEHADFNSWFSIVFGHEPFPDRFLLYHEFLDYTEALMHAGPGIGGAFLPIPPLPHEFTLRHRSFELVHVIPVEWKV